MKPLWATTAIRTSVRFNSQFAKTLVRYLTSSSVSRWSFFQYTSWSATRFVKSIAGYWDWSIEIGRRRSQGWTPMCSRHHSTATNGGNPDAEIPWRLSVTPSSIKALEGSSSCCNGVPANTPIAVWRHLVNGETMISWGLMQFVMALCSFKYCACCHPKGVSGASK